MGAAIARCQDDVLRRYEAKYQKIPQDCKQNQQKQAAYFKRINRNDDPWGFGILEKAHQSLTRFLAPSQKDNEGAVALVMRLDEGSQTPVDQQK